MSTAPPTRNAKRQRKKEGAQARRAAELAALRRQQRNRRLVRFALLAGASLAAVLLISALGGDDDADTASDTTETTETTAATDLTTTTVAPVPATPLTCAPPSGDNTDLTAKPTVEVPAEPATELTCQDLVVGDGAEVTNSNDTVQVHYVGVAQSTGKEFDTSWGAEPVSFPLTGVISGWTEGIPGMKVGGRRVLTIPADKGYGDSGSGPDIGPGETLVFVIDLLEVNPGS